MHTHFADKQMKFQFLKNNETKFLHKEIKGCVYTNVPEVVLEMNDTNPFCTFLPIKNCSLFEKKITNWLGNVIKYLHGTQIFNFTHFTCVRYV